MNPQQYSQLLSQMAAMRTQIGELQSQFDSLGNDGTLPDAIVTAFQTRIFLDSNILPSAFDQTLSSTPGGVVVPLGGDGIVDIGNDYYLIKYKKL